MKIRTGFVSNSSSSSFIISTEHFPTVKSLAKKMLEIQSEDYDKEYKNRCLSLIEKLNNVDANHPISFSSCNYDTYIRKIGDCLFVSTCNNTDWDLWNYSTRITESAKEELKKMVNDPFYSRNDKYSTIQQILDGDISDFSHFGIDFYDLDHDIVGVEIYDSCKKSDDENHRFTYLWQTLKYGKICLICDKPILERKDKLEQINQLREE